MFRETIFTFASAQFRCLIRLRVMMKMHLPVRGKWRGLDNEQETSSQEPWMLFLAVTLYLSDLEQISPSHCLGPNSLLCLIGLLWECLLWSRSYGVKQGSGVGAHKWNWRWDLCSDGSTSLLRDSVWEVGWLLGCWSDRAWGHDERLVKLKSLPKYWMRWSNHPVT